jgi:probable rRNA maturation factor
MSRLERPAIDIQISIEGGDWPDEAQLRALCRKTINAATRYLAEETDQPLPAVAPELSMLFTDDGAMREINGEWRAKDQPTNVLSFPASPVAPGEMPAPMLGDIVLAFETIFNEANELDRKFSDHLAHLIVHGYLHLFGYDHMTNADAEIMEGHETRILATIGVSDPYGNTDPA